MIAVPSPRGLELTEKRDIGGIVIAITHSSSFYKFNERVFCDPEFLCGLCYRVEHFFQKSATD